MLKAKNTLRLPDLAWHSILEQRPKAGQFILMAWDISNYYGVESVYWDKDDEKCKYCVMWLPLTGNDVFSNSSAVRLFKRSKYRRPILKWSFYFSKLSRNKEYINKDMLPKVVTYD